MTDVYSVSVIILGVIVSEFPDEAELMALRGHVTSSERRDAIRSSRSISLSKLILIC